jgi:hypothetical protein
MPNASCPERSQHGRRGISTFRFILLVGLLEPANWHSPRGAEAIKSTVVSLKATGSAVAAFARDHF